MSLASQEGGIISNTAGDEYCFRFPTDPICKSREELCDDCLISHVRECVSRFCQNFDIRPKCESCGGGFGVCVMGGCTDATISGWNWQQPLEFDNVESTLTWTYHF